MGANAVAISLADYNNDGRLDMFSPGFLYKQESNGSFTNVLDLAGLDFIGEGQRGGVFGDANFDGLLDLLIFDADPGSPLYLNRSGGIFERSSISTNFQVQRAPIGGFWRDLNSDGWLDFGVAYRNGNHGMLVSLSNGRFSDQGATYFFTTPSPNCGLVPGDYDNDGDTDVFGLGCSAPNSLLNYANQTFRPRFTDRGSQSGVSSRKKSTVARWIDYDNDGLLDLIVGSDYEELNDSEPMLYHNLGNGLFQDVAVSAGLTSVNNLLNHPLEVADFNNDGWIDIFMPTSGLGKLFKNNGDGTFEEIFEESFGFRNVPPVVVAGDVNSDGWMDLVMAGTGILFNDGGNNNWITFEAKEDVKNRFGVGAKIVLTTPMGLQTRVIEAGIGSLGHGDGLKAHFGLGSATTVERVEIHWPDAGVDILTNLEANQHYVLVSGIGVNDPPSAFSLTAPPPAGFVPVSADSIHFEWEPSTDLDQVSYTFSISGKGTSLTFPKITTESFSLPTALLSPNQVYQWSVRSTDGHSVRYNGEERIVTFGQADNSVSTVAPPIAYNYGLPEISAGTARFIDFDLDGDLDVIMGGVGKERDVLQLYQSEYVNIQLPGDDGGSYQFKGMSPYPNSLEPVTFPKITWGSVFDDVTPELIVSGISTVTRLPKTTIYINAGNDVVPIVGSVLPHVWGGNVDLADMDGDGSLELFITGAENLTEPYSVVSKIYRNNGNASFVDTGFEVPGFMFGDSAWGDMDGDGDLDLAMTGSRGNGDLFSAIFRNNGSGFSDLQANLPGLLNGTVSWADFDRDGDLDLFLTGGKLGPEILHGHSALYVNENGTFVQHPFPFDGILLGEAAWGDYDADGDPDLLLSGSSKPYGSSLTRLYRNDNGQFAAELDLEGLTNASIAFGDYNEDGDADILIIGKDKDGKTVVQFLINQQIPELIPGR